MRESAISLENVRICAGRTILLDLPQFSVAGGEAFAIIGPNGAGKSTLLKTCLGFIKPTTGQVKVLGHDVQRLSAAGLTRLRRRIGYVPQVLAARSEMPLTVREVVAIGRTGLAGLFRALGREDWRFTDEWIDRLGLARLSDQAYGELSGGEQRKTLIARAMVQQPELLLLDEPTAHLDLGWREQIVATLERLYKETHVTVVLVCHEMEVLPRSCRRIALLERGQLITCGAPEAVLTAQRVKSLYGPGLSVVHNAGRHAVIPSAESDL